MDEELDPSAAPEEEDFLSLLAQVTRSRKMAEQLRKRADEPGIKPQMVSGFYVKPRLSSKLVKGVQNWQAGRAEDELDKSAAGYDQRAAEARSRWANSNFPKSMPAVQDRVQTIGGYGQENEVQGPDLSPAQPLTEAQVFKKYLSGVNIPGNKDAATSYRDIAIKGIEREDKQAFQAQESAEKRIAAAQKVVDELAYKREVLAQMIVRDGDNADIKRMIADNNAALGQAQIDLGYARIDAQKSIAELKAQQAKDAKAAGKPLTVAEINKLQPKAQLVENADRFKATFKDTFSGKDNPLGISSGLGTYSPIATKNMRESSTFWNDYQRHKNTVRHELFGSALTSTEYSEWKKSDIDESMDAEQIRKNLNRRAELERAAYEKLEAAVGATTREGGLAAIRPAPAPVALPSSGGTIARPKNKAERDALPPGTPYIGPDGLPATR